MNKKIRRIIAITLVVSAFSTIAPVKYLKLVTTEVYAATTTAYGISNLEVNEGSGSNNLQLYNSSNCNATDKISFTNSNSKYYVETNSNGVNITVNEQIGYYTKVKRGSSGDYNPGDRIHIANGDTMTLNVYVYDKVTDNKVNSYSVSVKQTTKSSSSTDYSYSSNNDDDDDNVYLDNIKLSEGDISFSSTKSTYTVNVGSSVDQIRVTALPEDEDDTVKINGTTVDDNDDYRKTVALTNGKNEINIRVRDEDNKLRTYTLYVYRGGSVDSTTSTTSANQEDNYQDDIFLDDLVFYNNIGEVNINFRPKVTTYNVNVSSATDSITLKATPEGDDNIVRVNDEKVNSKHSRGVDLKEGKNVIQVKVDNTNDYEKDDDEYKNRIYTLNVYRGAASTGTTTTTSGSATNTQNNTPTIKANQWVSVSGKWQYNGQDGIPLKNQWHFDNNYAKWYYFDGNGFMHTGWLALSSGWYYLNANGSMATGWIEDGGKYYHLNSNGAMDRDTIIDKYVLGSNGAWIG